MKAQWWTTWKWATTTLVSFVSDCLEYFTTSADAMHCHSQLCKMALTGITEDNDDWEEESDIDDNSKDDNNSVFG